jgi:hypothetical protein
MKHALPLIVLSAACGGGVPLQIRIDDLTMELPLDEAVEGAYQQFLASGFLSAETPALPELWPDSLPDIVYKTRLLTPAIPVDLSPEPPAEGEEPDPDADKYAQINDAKNAIQRIEMNKFVLRIEQSTLSVTLPELFLQIADKKDANPKDRLAWWTVGRLPATPEARWVGDLEFEFEPGGESLLNGQLADDEKELAMRVVGNVVIDTAVNPARPSGTASLRLILIATFFVRPEGAL